MNYLKQFICCLFIGFIILVGFTASNDADVNAYVENSNYVYLALEEEAIIDDNGVVLLMIEHEENGLNIMLNISVYDYYYLSYKNDELTNLYVADVHIKENIESESIVVTNIKIYNDYKYYFDPSKEISIEVSCYDPNTNKLYIANGVIGISIFNRLTKEAMFKVLSDDELSKNILNSLNSLTDFQSINDENNVSTKKLMNMSTLSTVDYDDYTDDDYFNLTPFTGVKIQNYFTDPLVNQNFDGFLFADENGYYEKDPIIGIVPEELFYTPGTHYHLGKEYGFFIKTVFKNKPNSDSYRYQSEVYIFDVITSWPTSSSTEAKLTIQPIFELLYECDDDATPTWPLKHRITVHRAGGFYSYDGKYSLGNISFDFNLYNSYATNQWEAGYKLREGGYIVDKSDYISEMEYEIVGTQGVTQSEGMAAIDDALEFGYSVLQLLPGFKLLDYLSYAEVGVKGFELIPGPTIIPDFQTTASQITYTSSYNTGSISHQESQDGGLVKSAYMYTDPNIYDLLVGLGQHAWGSIDIASADENMRNQTGIVSNIKLDIFHDTRDKVFFIIPIGSLTKVTTLEVTKKTSYRLNDKQEIDDGYIYQVNTAYEKTVNSNDKKIIEFIFEKTQYVDSQVLEINFDSKQYNGIYATISFKVYDIDWNLLGQTSSGPTNQLILNMDVGRYYIIATVHDSTAKFSYSVLEHKNLTDGRKIIYYDGHSDGFGFTVQESKYYEFNISTNPVLGAGGISCSLYDIHGNLIERQIEGSIQLIVKLNAGEKYYIEYWVRHTPFTGKSTFQFNHRDELIYSGDYINTINDQNINFTSYGAISVERWINDQGWQYLGTTTFTQNGTKDNITISNNLIVLGTYNGKQLMTNNVIGMKKHRVTFSLNGGNPIYPNYKDVTYNLPYGTLPTPTKANANFKGWCTYDGRTVTSSSIVTIDDNHTLYARWEAHYPMITLYSTGGTTEQMYNNSGHGFSVESEDLLAMGYNRFEVIAIAVEEGRYVTLMMVFNEYGLQYSTYDGMTIEWYFSYYYGSMEGGVFAYPDDFVGSPHIVAVYAYADL